MWEFFTRDVELEMRPVFCVCQGTCTSILQVVVSYLGGDTVCWPLPQETANHGITSSGGDVYLTSVGGRLVVFNQMLKRFPDPG